MKKITVNTRMIPLFRDAGFDLRDAIHTREAFDHEKDHPHFPDAFIYSRYRNPTVTAVEENLAGLEASKWSLLTQSGMSAIDTVLSVFQSLPQQKPWLFFSEIYGGTNSYIDKVLKDKRGISIVRFVTDGLKHDMQQLARMLEEVHPALVYFETISNPMLIVAEAKEVISLAKKAGSTVIVDNTFATSYLWKPLQHGADIVIHSGTKYLSGHGNLSAGIVSGNDTGLLKEIIEYRKLVGHMISPDDALRLNSYLKTFSLRMERHCENAASLAALLQRHVAVERVFYPGLSTHPTHEEAATLFGEKGYGGMVTFDLRGDTPQKKGENRDSLIKNLGENISLVPTLGDADTILLPIEPVWGDKYPEPGMIRLSVGLEDTGVLKQRLQEGLDKI